jgi:hypothetical protein
VPIVVSTILTGARVIYLSWLLAGSGSFWAMEIRTQDAPYAIVVGAISAFGAALIAGVVKIAVVRISTSRSAREMRETEITNDIKRLHAFYADKLAFVHEQLRNETNILRIVRKAKHSMISDVGARDLYIDDLEDLLHRNNVPFQRVKFRNLAEASIEEDEQVSKIVKQEIKNGATKPHVTSPPATTEK